MDNDQFILSAISPLDGRYRSIVDNLANYFSEYSLIKYRLKIEIDYLLFFHREILQKPYSRKVEKQLIDLTINFNSEEALKVKKIEANTHHDVKSIEYYLRDKMSELKINGSEYIHIGLTSEDINAISYSLSIQESRKEILIPQIEKIIEKINHQAQIYAKSPMIGRTHGQVAVPTTMGKELLVFGMRLNQELNNLKKIPIETKFNGAVGNYNALVFAYPKIDWLKMSEKFIRQFGLTPNLYTTQILPADSYVRVFQSLQLINSILLGFAQDIWRYISDGYFRQEVLKNQVGSSTMPQKVNPIDFENAEGNLGMANSMLSYLSSKLPVSRLQRDLSDSTVKRNIGPAFGYCLVAYKSIQRGLQKITFNPEYSKMELLSNWNCITEAIQTLLRTSGDAEAYEKLKKFSRGTDKSESEIKKFIANLEIPDVLKAKLLGLSPLTYLGLSEKIVIKALNKIEKEK